MKSKKEIAKPALTRWESALKVLELILRAILVLTGFEKLLG